MEYWNAIHNWIYASFSWFSPESQDATSLGAARRFSRQFSSTGPSPNGTQVSGSPTGPTPNRRHFGSIDGTCPICLGEFSLPCETNCGHLFCSSCLMYNFRHTQLRGGSMRCPVCRQQVTIIFPCFSRSNSPSPDGISPSEDVNTLLRDINDYNRRYSNEPRPWLDYLYDLPTMLRHLSTDFFSFNGLAYVHRMRIVMCLFGAIMYIISPLDMIPEAVFGFFGLLDDIIIVLLLAIYATIIYRSYLLTRWGGQPDDDM